MPCPQARPDAKGRGAGPPEVGSRAECSGFPAQAVDSAPPVTANVTDGCDTRTEPRWGSIARMVDESPSVNVLQGDSARATP